MMDNKDYKKFYLIREDVLPESVVKTLKIKDALKVIRHCPFMMPLNSLIYLEVLYKYRETIFPVDDKMLDHREFTLILYVTDIVGMLARVLDVISKLELSVLTIHQSIPMEEKATITLSLNAKSKETSVEDVIWHFEKFRLCIKSRIN